MGKTQKSPATMDELSMALTSGEFIACTVVASQMCRHLCFSSALLPSFSFNFCFPSPSLPSSPLLSPPFLLPLSLHAPSLLFPSPLAVSRLQKVLQSSRGKVVVGGETNPSSRYIAPTVLSDVEETDPVMTEEVGPALTQYMSCW